jgi:hypothetical protein
MLEESLTGLFAVDIKNYSLIITGIIFSMTIIQFAILRDKKQKSLQWWSSRQSMRLFREAEIIRDSLLQYSFSIRRNLEMLPADDMTISTGRINECLQTIDNFHDSLAKLSDRLFPAYLPDSLSLAIQSTLENYQLSHPNFDLYLDIPSDWSSEPAEGGLIIVRAIEELLKICIPNTAIQTSNQSSNQSSNQISPTSVRTRLKQQGGKAELIVQITYDDIHTLSFYANLPEARYLCDAFQFLTSGKCFYIRDNLSLNWHLSW